MPSIGAVEAQVHEVGGHDPRVIIEQVVEAEGGSVPSEHRIDRTVEPVGVANLDGDAPVIRGRCQEGIQSLRRAVPARRQLHQHRAEGRAQGGHRLLEACQPVLRIAEPLQVRPVAAQLDREDEVVRDRSTPPSDRAPFRQAVERGVELDGREALRVVAQTVRRRQLRRIEAPEPVVVLEAGSADAESGHVTGLRARTRRGTPAARGGTSCSNRTPVWQRTQRSRARAGERGGSDTQTGFVSLESDAHRWPEPCGQ